MKRNKGYAYDIEAFSLADREEEIIRLELERLKVARELEETMQKHSRLTGIRLVPRRKYKVGRAPNDWSGRRYREYFGKKTK